MREEKLAFQKAMVDLGHKPISISDFDHIEAMYELALEKAQALIASMGDNGSTSFNVIMSFGEVHNDLNIYKYEAHKVIDEEHFFRDFYAGEIALNFIEPMRKATGGQAGLVKAIDDTTFASSFAWNRYNINSPGLFRAFALSGVVDYPLIQKGDQLARTTDMLDPLMAGIPHGRHQFLSNPERLSRYLMSNVSALQSEKTATLPMLELAAYCVCAHVREQKVGNYDSRLDENLKLILSFMPDKLLASFDHALSYQMSNYLQPSESVSLDDAVNTMTSFFVRYDTLKSDYALMALPQDMVRPELTLDLANYINITYMPESLSSVHNENYAATLLSILFTRYQFDIFSVEAEDFRKKIPEGVLSHLEDVQFRQQSTTMETKESYQENLTEQFSI